MAADLDACDAPRPERGGQQRADESERRGPAARYREFRRSLRLNPLFDLSWRIGVLSVGGVVLAAGLAMLALPGPGWATILLGLVILGSEFTWARRSLEWTKVRAVAARDRALNPEVRRRNQLIAMGVAAVVVVAVVVYWRSHGFPGPVGQWILDHVTQ